jgi:hypothetical protein
MDTGAATVQLPMLLQYFGRRCLWPGEVSTPRLNRVAEGSIRVKQ